MGTLETGILSWKHLKNPRAFRPSECQDAYLLLLSDDVSFSAKYGQVIFDKAFIFGIDIDGNFLMLTAEQVGTVKKELVLGSKAGGMFLEVWLDAE